MSHPNEAHLLSSLPAEIGKPLAKALAAPKLSEKRATTAFVEAARALGFPSVSDRSFLHPLTDRFDDRWRGVMPTAEELTPPQRAFAEILAYRDAGLYFHDGSSFQLLSIPETTENRQRWLGLKPGGALEEGIEPVSGDGHIEPVWHCIQKAYATSVNGHAAVRAFFASLPMLRQLRILGDLTPPRYGLSFVLDKLLDFWDPRALGSEGAAWAPACADYLLSIRSSDAVQRSHLARARYVVFLALIRGGVRLERRWEALVPFERNPNTWAQYVILIRECLFALPEERRAVAASLCVEDPADQAMVALSMLDLLPCRELARRALSGALASQLPQVLAKLERLAEGNDEVRAVVDDYRLAAGGKKPPKLSCKDAMKPSSASDLSATQRLQLETFGRAYDGQELDADARLRANKGPEDGSFYGFLEIVPIIDTESDSPAFEAFLAVDSGSVFRTGTAEQVAAVIQGSLDLCGAPTLFEGLSKALAGRPKKGKPGRPKQRP